MIFNIQSLSFSLGTLTLESWRALLARGVCALLLLGAGWLARAVLRSAVFPKLLAHKCKFAAVPILLGSFAVPTQRAAWLTGVFLALYSLPWAAPSIPKLLFTAYQMLFTLCVCEGLYKASDISGLLLASSAEEIRSNKTLVSLLNRAYKIIIVVLGIATIAQESGLPVGSIVAGAGLAGLTVSLAAQDTASNLFSGLVILIERPFSIGDWITVGDIEGEVIDITFRSTKIRSVDNTVNILTNSHVSSSTINNGTKRTKRLYRFTLGVTYDTTRRQLEKLMADITSMLKTSPYTYEDSVFVKLTEFGSSSINLSVFAYLRTPDAAIARDMQNELNLNIMDIMKSDDVQFAFPSTTVYIAGNGS